MRRGRPLHALGMAVLTLLFALHAARAANQTEGPSVVVHIDTATPSKPYSPLIFGGLIEHFGRQVYGGIFEPGSPLSDKNGFRKDVIAALKEMKVSVVRWPGGCFASGYHWKDGVGKDRRPVPDPVWGVTDPNTFGTDEFIEWCRLVGCEPYICANAGNGTPEEMKQWLEYCNATEGNYAEMRKANGHDAPFNVKYWSIGNENYGFWEIGRYSPETWAPFVKRCADTMLSVDPDIKLVGPVWRPKYEWYGPLLKAAGEDLDYIGVHQYWIRTSKETPYKGCIGYVERSFADVIGNLEKTGCRGKVKIAFDEWNLRGWHHPNFPRKSPVKPGDEKAAEQIAARKLNAAAKQYTMADAVFSACFLNACLRHCEDVGMANIAPVVNTRGPLYVHPKGIVKRTTFHTLAMYANELEERVAPLEVEQPGSERKGAAKIDAIATVDRTGKKWAIVLVNRHPTEHVATAVKMGGKALDGKFEAMLLSGDSPEAYNDIDHPDRVVPEKKELTFKAGVVKLPPHSLIILRESLGRVAPGDCSPGAPTDPEVRDYRIRFLKSGIRNVRGCTRTHPCRKSPGGFSYLAIRRHYGDTTTDVRHPWWFLPAGP